MTISCHECRERLVLSFDGEDDVGDLNQVVAHLQQCQGCQAFSEDLIRIRRELVLAPWPPLGSSVRERLLAVVRAETANETGLRVKPALAHLRWIFRPSSLRWVGGLAALVLLLASWSLCFYLGGQVAALRQKLERAQREAATPQSTRDLEHKPSVPQAASSDLYDRTGEPEERVQLPASLRRTYF
jgi:hypothetical protein